MQTTKKVKRQSGLSKVGSAAMISEVPFYANRFFYSLGFLSMISFVILLVTGIIMTLNGPDWWLVSSVGKFVRSIHLWSTQAFVLFVLLHLIVVFCTSGFKKPRRLTWVIGVIMFFALFLETEFGYVLRGDFSSQWRLLQGADFYNGAGLGRWINTLNYKQMYGIHVSVIPFLIVGLLLTHYALVRVLGIANHKRNDVRARVVPADHTKLFIRGGVLIVLIFALAIIFPSPYLKPTTVRDIAQQDPNLMAKTLVAEISKTSDTATYMDNIDPYTYDVQTAYITTPYDQYLVLNTNAVNYLAKFNTLSAAQQAAQLKTLQDYYGADNIDAAKVPKNDAENVIKTLVAMAATGAYESSVAQGNNQATPGDQTTYVNRFLSDTGVLEARATALSLTTPQYGMLHEESNKEPVGAWWLAPIGILNHTVLASDDNGDRDAAIIFGALLLVMVAFPYIPGLNAIPEKLRLYKPFQRREKK